MSNSFNFPASPALNQIVGLPDGNQAQWNGYAWVSVEDNVTYPLGIPLGGTGATNPLTAKRNLAIPIFTLDDTMPAAPVYGDRWVRPGSMTEVVWLPNANNAGVWVNLADVGSIPYPLAVAKGGTGATTAAQARINLGIDYTTSAFLISDGTVAAPGLAFASELGLGWFRSGAGKLYLASGGTSVFTTDTAATNTAVSVYPKAAGTSSLGLSSGAAGAANANVLGFNISSTVCSIFDGKTGTATALPLSLLFPAGVIVSAALKAASGMGMRFDGTNANFLCMGSDHATNWNLTWNHTTGDLAWLGGTSTSLFSVGNTGDAIAAGSMTATKFKVAASIQLWDNGSSSLIGMQGNANFNWTWAWDKASGLLHWIGGAGGDLIQFAGDGSASKAAAGTTWLNISDQRAKKDVVDWDGGLERILSLRPREFTLIDSGERAIGCIADEAETGFPEIIRRGPGKLGHDEVEDLAMLHIDPLFWALVNAVKTLNARLAQLEAA